MVQGTWESGGVDSQAVLAAGSARVEQGVHGRGGVCTGHARVLAGSTSSAG